MRRRTSMLLTGGAAAVATIMLAASSTQISAGSGGDPSGLPERVTLLAAGPADAPRALPPGIPAAPPKAQPPVLPKAPAPPKAPVPPKAPAPPKAPVPPKGLPQAPAKAQPKPPPQALPTATPKAAPAASPKASPPVPAAVPPAPAVVLSERNQELAWLAKRATAEAKKRGADISLTVLDRATGQLIASGDRAPFPLASVAKLFIADDLLTETARRKAKLSPEERRGLDLMLRSSDDFPADDFWIRGGGNAIISRINARYKLSQTTAPYDGNWWNTMSTTADLVRYYDMLLDGTGGLPAQQAAVMLADLASSTPVGTDGYPQRFGIPDGLFAEKVAVKQGWMCCWGPDNQVHLSTGVVGPDRRYVIALASMQPADEATARNTMTQTLKTMFPSGRI